MPYYEFVWTERARAKIELHGVSCHEVEEVICRPDKTGHSHSSGRPMAMGWLDDGRWLVCIYEELDELRILPITAYFTSGQS